ncbi:AAA family ATPase [Pseudomonas citronellolis]|uniref:ATP-binding protein n=1 Tax=Pseudomonas citronellolis TaxID=53408 RepID=A0AAW6P0N8_9PSED|nr:ATP-binding protein [Pseudomonas citronellolis]MCP1606429.1 DNA transposition AAA+ family ATPase [Pseudomonas citronellolis]MCP1657135.1 DNA transposition AAA+ family ATPase [Pseudomonas citronellolis]MCP1724132.1 DNA transposition AAA+ family ATPase [Pseudomonas citronellolis]MDF3840454.1 ATP-binding protein [Pseudomonas citronellolis]WRT82974.1 ATP-binding protein [Pseudomonas citronellolis]
MSKSMIAPLTNVGLLSSAIDRAMQRPLGLPGLVVMYGASGLGKSVSAAFAANMHRAYYVECRDTWSKKAFLLAILREMGLAPSRTLSEMVDQVAEQLSRSGRPLLVDDAQYLLDKAVANVITDIYNASQGTIVLIGEERVPGSLAKLERLHNRVLEWVPAQPATLDDLRTLASATYPSLEIEDELLDDLRQKTRGCLRRAAVNLYRISTEAQAHGVSRFGMAHWGKRPWFTGEAPARRA